MPNGYGRNFDRLRISFHNFRRLYNQWPTIIYLHQALIHEFTNTLDPESLEELDSRVKIIKSTNRSYFLKDDKGNSYQYGGDKDDPSIMFYEIPENDDWVNNLKTKQDAYPDDLDDIIILDLPKETEA